MKLTHTPQFVLAALFAASAFAQQGAGMVKVDLSTVADTLAKNIKVDVGKIPPSMQLPVSVAASACGMPAAKLTATPDGATPACQATSSSVELENVVGAQLKMGAKQ